MLVLHDELFLYPARKASRVCLMTEFVRFIERSKRENRAGNWLAGEKGIGSVDPRALAAMQETRESWRPGDEKGREEGIGQAKRGSQHFLQGGLSAPITVTW